MKDENTLEQAKEFYEFLQGTIPELRGEGDMNNNICNYCKNKHCPIIGEVSSYAKACVHKK